MIRDAALLNTQHYKVLIKGKWGNQGKGVTLSPIEKIAFGSPSTTVDNFTLYIYK